MKIGKTTIYEKIGRNMEKIILLRWKKFPKVVALNQKEMNSQKKKYWNAKKIPKVNKNCQN